MLFFGIIIGGLTGIAFMCLLQANRIEEYEFEINMLKKMLKEKVIEDETNKD